MYEDVLLPTDGSDEARRAVEHGLELATAVDARVHVVYVVDTNELDGHEDFSPSEHFFDELGDVGEQIVGSVVEAARERGLEARETVERGVPHVRIADYVDENEVDAVVMGGRERDDDVPRLGHVADRVLRTLDVPVTVV